MQSKGDTRYQRQLKGKQGQSSVRLQGQTERRAAGTRETLDRTRARIEGDEIDKVFGFERLKEGLPRLGWLLNYLPVTMPDETGMEKSGMDLYFIDQEGGSFKASIFYAPYFFIDYSDPRRSVELTQHLMKKFEGCSVTTIDKEDLDMPNHLSGRRHKFLKIEFRTVNEMNDAKNVLRPIVLENQKRLATSEDFFMESHDVDTSQVGSAQDLPTATIVDLREHDVLYPMRVSIDLELRVGSWFVVTPEYGSEVCSVVWQKEMLDKCEPRMLAFDIECEKSPLKFPNPEVDRIYMISYMVANQGYLIINREIVSEDIENFEYTPKPQYPGNFEVFNLKNEEACLQFFIDHVKKLKPHVFVTYNGDKFDFPYVEIRCSKYPALGTLYSQLGMRNLSSTNTGAARRAQIPKEGDVNAVEEKPAAALFSEGEYTGRCIVHLDAFAWVQRDSYLPQGNQGLKAVTKYKLGYDPVEVDPEDMLRFAQERPHYMASYSVSDAVATYYLYTTYVHNFIFSLSTIIPLASEDVLRKGSGTLCEALLMVEAYRGNIICPNKQVDPLESYHEGHLLESETYIGGHVECLEAGVFRADIPAKFNLVPSALQQLINNIDRDLTFALEVEHGLQRTDALNYDEIKQAIVSKLEFLRDNPVREEGPIIYHLDVGAMYPNIILTNRLQPAAIVSTSDCAACEFNRAENGCKRPMNWTWRGEYSPATTNEYISVKRQLSYEKVLVKGETIPKPFTELDEKDQIHAAKERLKLYSNRVYRKTKVTSEVERTSTVCMRENSFYVDTVKAFRDRRYDYKLLTKTWKNKKTAAEKANDPVARKFAEDREVLMDSLQLAHKCILNSFYGYVMRKGARWRSMEMAGIVTHTGALLIKQARELVEQVGRPLELDTDGIWCILPSSFPQDFKMKTRSSGNVSIGYPCAMLNADVHERYTNHQYQDLSKSNVPGGVKKYDKHSECSIFFELDGPYKAMVLPASAEEGKLLKKKYVVFNFNGSIAELKGFELKRRGELELVKIFQSQVFDQFLNGTNLTECYASVGAIANQWLDVLDEKGYSMDDSELLELISERKTISKTVEDYAGRKSTSLTTAGRLADFLGAEMIKDKGLNCNLIISRLPAGAPVTERAIPVAIFSCEPAVRKYYLRKWLKDNTLDCEDFRDVVDWQYYKERLGKSIQKIVTIPAGIQRIANPCPRVEHPSWLSKQIAEKNSGKKQMSILASFKSATVPGAKLLSNSAQPVRKVNLFGDRPNTVTIDEEEGVDGPPSASKKRVRPAEGEIADLEDFGTSGTGSGLKGVPRAHNFKGRSTATENDEAEEVDEGINENDDPALEAVTDRFSKIVLPLSEHKPEDMEEMHSWLSNRKDHWKKLRAERRANKQLISGTGGGRVYGNPYRPGTAVGSYSNTTSVAAYSGKKAIGVLDYVRNAQLAITQHCWQVLELQETDVPGEFKVWALTTPTQLQCVTMIIPRTLYVNVTGVEAQQAAEALGGVKVKRDLPHAKPGHVLYEISIPEHKYIRNEKALNLFLSNGQVEGVYESQVPLNLRGILQMGCVTRCINAKAQMTSNKFRLSDMELVHVNSFPYLEKNVATFKRIFVYFANNSNSNGNLGVLALFIIDTNNVEEENTFKSSTRKGSGEFETLAEVPLGAKAFVWLINGRGTATMDTVPPLQKIYRRFQPNDTANVKFVSSFARTASDAYRMCNEKLMNYQRERHGPTIIIAQGGSMDAPSWRYNLPMLHEYPLTVIPTNNSDNLYPAVGWQFFTCERLVQRYLIVPNWFYDRVSCARYAHIPVCNLGNDALTTIIDTIYSRQLIHNRHLLWCSEGSNTPDIGTSATSATDSALVQLDDVNSSVNEVVINNSGVYRNICIELDVYGLAVCSIMSSGELDAEGLTALNVNTSAGAKSTSASSGVLGETATGEEGGADEKLPMVAHSSGDSSCARAFSILKAMVTKCIEEVARRNDRISDSILTALYRYLCGYGNGLLSDPALHKVVYNLMTQLFKKLITGFNKLGTKVIYADFGRIIVATNKQEYSAAKEYIDFIVSAITNKDVFAFVQVNVKSYWEQLVWLGPENFGGVPLTENSGTEAVEVEEGEERAAEVVDITGEPVASSGAGAEVVDMTDADPSSTPEAHTDDEEEEVDTQRVEEVPPPAEASAAAPAAPKPVKIASIFTKRGPSASAASTEAATGNSSESVALQTPFDAVKTLDKSKSKISKLASHKFQRETVKSSEYDFLDDVNKGLTDENGDLNLDTIKNAYRSRRPANKKRSGGKVKKTVRYVGEDGDLEGSEIDEEGDGESEGEYNSDESDVDDYRSVDEGGDRWLDDADPYYGSGGNNAQDFYEEAEDEGPAVSHWNLVTYYPPAVATYFRFIIQEFLLQYQAKRDELLAVREARQSGGMSQYTQMQADNENNPLDDESIALAVTEYMKKFITQRFTAKMLEFIDEINVAYPMLHGAATSQVVDAETHETVINSVFPKRAGSHLRMTSPALEFVKSTTHVMSLDPTVREEVSTLKRMLLAQLRVREFNEESQFKDPCLSFMLRDVICSFCSTCRDLDLLRDGTLTNDNPSVRWLCVHCNNSINTEEVENRLLDEVDKLTAVYLLQDVRCTKTKRASQRHATAVSDLCQPLVMDFDQQSMRQKLQILLKVAEYHEFKYLEVAVKDLIATNH